MSNRQRTKLKEAVFLRKESDRVVKKKARLLKQNFLVRVDVSKPENDDSSSHEVKNLPVDSAVKQSESININSDTKPVTSGNDLVEEQSLKVSHTDHGKESQPKKKKQTAKTFKTSKPRGRPKRIRTTFDINIAHVLRTYKAIRKGRRRVTSLPGDGRVNGLVLSSIRQLLPSTLDVLNVPRTAEELVEAGINQRDVGAVLNMLQIPKTTGQQSEFKFPANLSSLVGLRGLILSQQKFQTDEAIPETDAEELGDPEENNKLTLLLERMFSWSFPFLNVEASSSQSGD